MPNCRARIEVIESNAFNDCDTTATRGGACMATMTIRNLDDTLKARLRVRAANRGRSMEDEAREILRAALAEEPGAPGNLVQSIRSRLAGLGGVDLPEIPREPMPEPVEFDA
jgi:plasmid stability protein